MYSCTFPLIGPILKQHVFLVKAHRLWSYGNQSLPGNVHLLNNLSARPTIGLNICGLNDINPTKGIIQRGRKEKKIKWGRGETEERGTSPPKDAVLRATLGL